MWRHWDADWPTQAHKAAEKKHQPEQKQVVISLWCYFAQVINCHEGFLFRLCHCKVKIKCCHARAAAPCSHCDHNQSRLHLCSRSSQQQRWWQSCPRKAAGLKVKPWPAHRGRFGMASRLQRSICYYTTELEGFHLLIPGNKNNQVESLPGQFCTKMQVLPKIMLVRGVVALVKWKKWRKSQKKKTLCFNWNVFND